MTFQLRLTTIDYRWSSVRLSESVIATEKVVDSMFWTCPNAVHLPLKISNFNGYFPSPIIQLELVVTLERSDTDGANVSIFALGNLVVKFGRNH